MDLASHLDRWSWPFPRDEAVVLGVSGGVDSMVLAEVMQRLGFCGLIVAHLHHGLRGSEADADADSVRAWAAARGQACEVGREAVADRAAAGKMSLETAGRAARQEFFRTIARRRGARHIVLAHHADDQVETVMMNLLRGAGTHGLSGMRRVVTWDGLTWVRPLLGVWRRELVAWAQRHEVSWREDATNQSDDHFRNLLRNSVLPALESATARPVRELLWRTAELAAEDDAALTAEAEAARTSLESPATGALDVAALRALAPALQRRILRSWLVSRGIPDVGFEVIEATLAVVRAAGRPASTNLAAGHRVRRRSGQLFIDAQHP